MKKLVGILRNPAAFNSAVMFIGTMAVNFGAYLYQVVVLRILGPAQYGELAALLSILFIISVPAQVAQTILTKLFAERKAHNDLGGAKALLFFAFKYFFIAGLIGLLLYIPFVPILQSSLKIHQTISVVSLYGIFVSVFLTTICVSFLNGFQKFAPSTLFMTISMILRLLSGIFFASYGVGAAIASNAAANMISFLLFFIPLAFLFKIKVNSYKIEKRSILQYAIPTLLVLLAVTMLYNVDVVLVKLFFSSEIAGIYGGLTIFGKIIFFGATAILLAVFPMVAEKYTLKKSYDQLVMGGLAGILLMSFTLVGLYFFLAPIVTHVLFGPRFDGVVPYLGLFGLFMTGVTVINYIGTISLAVHRTGIWKIIMAGALIQIASITIFHSSLLQVIVVNIVITFLIAAASLLYYFHEARHS